jgi:hypothetical protein
MRKGKRRPPKHVRQAFRAGNEIPNLLRTHSRQRWGVRKKGKLIKLANNTYAIERSFSSERERLQYVQTIRRLRQFCKTHPFTTIEFAPVHVKTVDGKGNRVWEQAIFAPSIDEVIVNFTANRKAMKTMSPYKRALLLKLAKHNIDPKHVSKIALAAVMGDLTELSDALFRKKIVVNLGTDYKHVLVTDYNPKTNKLVVSIAGDVTDPYSIF